jgi:hypothetical protein
MSDLRKLAQPLLDRPPLPPRPVAEIRRAARKRQRQYRAVAGDPGCVRAGRGRGAGR